MKTAADRLQFVINLVNTSLNGLRPGDWMNLKDDLCLFLSPSEGTQMRDMGGIIATPLIPPLPQDYTENDFLVLQNSFKDMLINITTSSGSHKRIHIEGDYALTPCFSTILFIASGSTKDMALLILMHLLSNEPSNRILLCPECNNYFYRVKKQAYCSRTCINRVTVRKWRESEESKEKESLAAHKRYANKVKATTGGVARQRTKKERQGGSNHGKKTR